jgi:hypothetical protein
MVYTGLGIGQGEEMGHRSQGMRRDRELSMLMQALYKRSVRKVGLGGRGPLRGRTITIVCCLEQLSPKCGAREVPWRRGKKINHVGLAPI